MMPTQTTLWNSSLSNNVDPGGAKKALGWVTNEQPASSTFNWYMQLVEQWLAWLQGLFGYSNTWTAQQTFTMGVLCTNTGGFGNSGFFAALPTILATGPNTLGPTSPLHNVYRDGGACVVTLPSSPLIGQSFTFQNAGLGTLQILPPAGRTLNGANSSTGITLNSQYQTFRCQFLDNTDGWLSW